MLGSNFKYSDQKGLTEKKMFEQQQNKRGSSNSLKQIQRVKRKIKE